MELQALSLSNELRVLANVEQFDEVRRHQMANLHELGRLVRTIRARISVSPRVGFNHTL